MSNKLEELREAMKKAEQDADKAENVFWEAYDAYTEALELQETKELEEEFGKSK